MRYAKIFMCLLPIISLDSCSEGKDQCITEEKDAHEAWCFELMADILQLSDKRQEKRSEAEENLNGLTILCAQHLINLQKCHKKPDYPYF